MGKKNVNISRSCFFGLRVVQGEDSLTTPRLVLVTVIGEKRMQTFLLYEGKGRWECSLSGPDDLGLL